MSRALESETPHPGKAGGLDRSKAAVGAVQADSRSPLYIAARPWYDPPVMRLARIVLMHALVAAQAALLCGVATGCERQAAPSRYAVLAGDVTACQNDIGEITVSVARRGGQEVAGETLHCTVTGDSEIYVNDRFSASANERGRRE